MINGDILGFVQSIFSIFSNNDYKYEMIKFFI